MKGKSTPHLSRAILTLIVGLACSAWAQGNFIGVSLDDLAPANDNFADATVIQTNSYADSTTLYGGTAEPGEPMHGGMAANYSRWWRWRAPADGVVEIDAYPERIGVYTGESLATLQAAPMTEPQFNSRKPRRFAAQAGVEYHIAGEPGLPSDYRAEWMFLFRFEFTQIVRTPLPVEAKLPPNAPVEIEYKAAAGTPAMESLTLLVDDTPFKTLVSGPFVFTYTNRLGGLVKIQAITTNSGKLYRSAVDRLQFQYPNDHFADAFEIDGSITRTNFDGALEFATAEANEPAANHYGTPVQPRRSRWYRWRPEHEGSLTWSGYYADLTQGVYEGHSLQTLTAVQPMYLQEGRFRLETNRTYYLRSASSQANWGATTLWQNTLLLNDGHTNTTYYVGDSVPLRIRNAEPERTFERLKFVSAYGRFPDFYVAFTNGTLETNFAPTVAGPYAVSVEGWNDRGDFLKSDYTYFTLRPANDLMDRATEIPSDGFGYIARGDADYAELEEGEPTPIGFSSSYRGSVWWKWTAPEDGSVVLRPLTNSIIGLRSAALSVFERSPSGLNLIADNRFAGMWSADGVYFESVAGKTYWIQGFASYSFDTRVHFSLERAPVKSFIFAAGPPTADFQRWKPLILDTNGDPVARADFRAQAYAGTNENSLRPIGSVVGLTDPGTFQVAMPLLEHVEPGTELLLQIRAWRWRSPSGFFVSSYELAEALGMTRGASAPGHSITVADHNTAQPAMDLTEFRVGTDRSEGTLAPIAIRWVSDGEVEITAPAAVQHSYDIDRLVTGTGWIQIQTVSNTTTPTTIRDIVTDGAAFYRTRFKAF